MKKIAGFLFLLALMIICALKIIPYSMIESVVVYVVAFLLPWTIVDLIVLRTKKGKNFCNCIRGRLFAIWTRQKEAKGLMISENVQFHGTKGIEIGNNVSIDNGSEFFPLHNGYPSVIKIGNNVHIGAYNRFACMNEVIIEDDVLFAAFVHITDHSHEFRDLTLPVYKQGVFTKGPVRICKGAWLGLRCNILSGVTIGEHSVVAAGSIVTKDVPAYSVVAGVPAKVIKRYDFERKEWIKV